MDHLKILDDDLRRIRSWLQDNELNRLCRITSVKLGFHMIVRHGDASSRQVRDTPWTVVIAERLHRRRRSEGVSMWTHRMS